MTDRTCILSGRSLPRDQLIRFVAGPDGLAVADLAEKLPGRGVWIENGADNLRKAAARNLLTRRIGVTFGDVEAEILRIAGLMRKRALAAAGMARRSGGMVGGAGKLAADSEGFAGLLAAPDASERELRKLESRLGVEWTSRLLTASELGQMFGRDSLAFAGIRGGGRAKPAENLRRELARLEGFSWSSACQAG
ncbi:MAG: DUF448 domain-containing protein [Candidatus Puniceispirillaceae bacterium]